MTSQRRISRRRGYVMVLVVMLLFGILAMAALVIDIGFARLTHRQMQSAVDSAALEGLRFRDDPNIADPVDRDRERRKKASNIVAWSFDDDLNALNGDDGAFDSGNGQFGAGPIVEFSGGAGEPNMYASQLMSVPSDAVYKPSNNSQPGLGLNEADSINGDMLAGSYIAEPPVGATAEELREFHREANNYTRLDFVAGGDSAFLVRMRRTGESPVDNVLTSGPPLPYLFGRGSLLNRQLIGNGIRVRATAIASARPVVAIGRTYSSAYGDTVEYLGALEIAIRETLWSKLPFFDVDPEIQVLTHDGIDVGSVANDAYSIGQAITLGTTTSTVIRTGYICIFDTFPSGDRVIGFGLAEFVSASGSEVGVRKLVRSVPAHAIASENATANLAVAWPALSTIDNNAERQLIRDRNRNVAHPLLAPVSVR